MFQPNLLKAAIARAGLTQGEFARGIGISLNSMTSRMNKSVSFNIDEVDKAKQVLGIDNDEICRIFFAEQIP
ncbi:MAG: DUF739 family protein [Erysipelotrichaceae bacterium]|nr:DUF739 family protein [Erysipelotrichaceae bacterium]